MHARFVGHHNGHFARLRQRLNQSPARRDQIQTVFDIEHAGRAPRRVFANAVTEHTGWFDSPRLPQLGKRELQREQRGLRVDGLIERTVRS